LLVFLKIGRRGWIGVDRALLIPESAWIDVVAGGIFQLIVNVLVVRPGIAHRADQLTRNDGVTDRDMPLIAMQNLVDKAILVLDGYSPYCALPRVYHDAVNGRVQFRVA